MTTIEIIFLVIAIAFVLLVGYVIMLASQARKTLQSLQKQLDDLGHEPRDFMRHSKEIAIDIHHKLKYIDPLFCALFKSCKREESSSFCSYIKHQAKVHPTESEENTMTELLEWGLLGLQLWKKFSNRR